MVVNTLTQYAADLGITGPLLIVFIILYVALIIWELVWKLMGMWTAAKNKSILWFIFIGIINTIGILPILYIYIFSKMGREEVKDKVPEVMKKRRRR